MKIFIAILVTIISLNLYSQDENYKKVLDYINEKNIEAAKNEIDKLVKQEKCKKAPRAYFYQGVVYQSMYEINYDNSADFNTLQTAYNAYKKALKYDVSKEITSMIIKKVGVTANLFLKQGVQEFNNKDYKTALKAFENTLEINSRAEIMYLDTIVIYNAALAAQFAGNFDKAEKYYKDLIIYNFEGSKMYYELANLYKQNGFSDDYMKTMKKGLKAYPEDNDLLVEIVNYHLSNNENEKAKQYLDKAIEMEPNNPTYNFVQGSFFEQKGNKEKAIEYYNKTLKFKPDYVDALFNIGAIYYNEGTGILKISKTKKEKKKAIEKYKKARPYFESVHRLDSSDKTTVKLLIGIYSVLEENDKKAEMEKKLKNL